jgi:hypothetical protein
LDRLCDHLCHHDWTVRGNGRVVLSSGATRLAELKGRISMYFNTTNTPTPDQRRVAVEACICAAIVESKRALRVDEIRKFVMTQPGFENVQIASITAAINQMRHRKRIHMVWQSMRTIPSYDIPKDPESPFVPVALAAVPPEVVERKIIQSLEWPKFFHLPCKEDIRPTSPLRRSVEPTFPG